MRILVVEDEQAISAFVVQGLTEAGYAVDLAADAAECLHWAAIAEYDVIVLDVMLPDQDGLTVCAELRRRGLRAPVLMVTARDAVDDRVAGLDSGADDYLLKPFNMDELMARVRALLRRVPSPNRPVGAGGGEISIDKQKREVLIRGEQVDLTPTEYDLLLLLAENTGTVLEHEVLLRGVWGQEYTKDNDYLKVYIWHLRRKIEIDPRDPKLLLTEWGVGYRLVP